jgi:aspartate carbamoyltransferase regulatory subunit
VTDVSERAGADSPAEALIKVSALREGTVIDHLVSGTALKVLSVLGMTFEGAVTIGLNLDSRKAGRKDIIKIERRELTPAEVARIALISPRATFSIIRDFKVVRKFTPELPDVVENLIKCPNPSCISNASWVATKFLVVRADPLRVRCHYCERSLRKDEIELV